MFSFFFRQHFSNLCICIEPQLFNENSNLLRHFCNALEKRSRLSLFKKLIGECRRVNNLYFLIIFTTKYSLRINEYFYKLTRNFLKFFFLSFKYIYQLTL